MAGVQMPLEMHIVHFIRKDQLPACGEAGCPAVLGVLLELTDNEDEVKPELRKIMEAMPLNEEESATISGTININNLLPANRTYITYEVCKVPQTSHSLLVAKYCYPVYCRALFSMCWYACFVLHLSVPVLQGPEGIPCPHTTVMQCCVCNVICRVL